MTETIEASLNALREIFLDPDVPPKARIEAAEAILTYEAPADSVEEAKHFLIEFLEDRHTAVSLRLEAAKVLRKAEAPKVQTRTVASADEYIEREKAREFLKMKRRLALYQAGLLPAPAGCFDDLDAADFDPIAALEAQSEAERAEKARLKEVLEEATKAKKECEG